MFKKISAAAVLFCCWIAWTPADQIIKNSGAVHTGEIVSRDEKKVVLRVTAGAGRAEIEIPLSDIKEIRKGKTEREKNRERFEQKLEDAGEDLGKLIAVAEWAENNRMVSARKKVYRKIIDVDPDNRNARTELGYIRHNGEWMTYEEKMLALGKVFFRGNWMDEETREDILREEAEARIREKIIGSAGKRLSENFREKKNVREWNPNIKIYEGYLFHRTPYLFLPCPQTRRVRRTLPRSYIRGHFDSGNWSLDFEF